ncbi:MAG: histidine phosphatase family protein [Thermomicrobiales bacterium]
MASRTVTHLYFVRHGETASNVNGLLHGVTDVPLNDIGTRQAELIADRMASFPDLNRIVSSPLQRALNTAKAIQRKSGLPLRIYEGLKEMNFGAAEGIPFNEISEIYPEQSELFLDPTVPNARYPGGESRFEFFSRVNRVVDDIAQQHVGEHIVVVAHGGFISAMLSVLFREHANNWRDSPIRNCSLTHIELSSADPIPHLVNDAVHLDQMDLVEGVA